MKKSNYLTRTLKQAHHLQGRYDHLGAGVHQGIRNPLPMRELILTVLPVVSSEDVAAVQSLPRLTKLGKAFTSTKVAKLQQKIQALTAEAQSTVGITIDEAIAKLEERGFFAKKMTVSMALNNAKYHNGVDTIRCNKVGGGRGSSHVRYFVRE